MADLPRHPWRTGKLRVCSIMKFSWNLKFSSKKANWPRDFQRIFNKFREFHKAKYQRNFQKKIHENLGWGNSPPVPYGREIFHWLMSSHKSSREIAISTSDTSFELRDVEIFCWKDALQREQHTIPFSRRAHSPIRRCVFCLSCK